MRIARFSIDGNVAFGAVEGDKPDELVLDIIKGIPFADFELSEKLEGPAEQGGPLPPESLKEAVLAAGETHGLKLGKAQAPVRVAVTGRTVGLPLFESLEVLGKETTLARIDAALAKLAA